MVNILTVIANWCSVVAMLGVVATFWHVYRTRKEAVEERERGTYGDMVKFVNVQAVEGVCIAPFKVMPFLPRIGERLTLPETPDGLKCRDYRVLSIHYVCFANDGHEDGARLMNVRVELEPY